MEKKIKKGFKIEETGVYYKTLTAAKADAKNGGHIYRVWQRLENGEAKDIGEHLVYAFGVSCALLADADDAIRTKIINEEIKHKRINCHG